MNVFICTCLALIAFAGNSLLCRLALLDESIDPASFTAIRLVAGAVTLAMVLFLSKGRELEASKGNWKSAIYLLVYALSFSFAYLDLDTGMGALILFGFVQVTMILLSIIRGDRLHYLEWMGAGTAFLGLAYLLLPGAYSPSLFGFFLMSLAGIAWGLYSVEGKYSFNPLGDTAYNFIRCAPLSCLILVAFKDLISITLYGLALAILSGAVTSGLGYTIWYVALRRLSGTLAAVVQLFVPVLAALAGVVVAGESITLNLIVSAAFVLGGILLVLSVKSIRNDTA